MKPFQSVRKYVSLFKEPPMRVYAASIKDQNVRFSSVLRCNLVSGFVDSTRTDDVVVVLDD